MKVPDAAAAIYQRADTYRSQIGSLDLMVRAVLSSSTCVAWPQQCAAAMP